MNRISFPLRINPTVTKADAGAPQKTIYMNGLDSQSLLQFEKKESQLDILNDSKLDTLFMS